MLTRYEDKIREQAKPYLESGERVLAAFITQPRGTGVAQVGGMAPSAIGGRELKGAQRAAQAGGLALTSPMALALTDARLVVFKVSQLVALGKGGARVRALV